MLQLSNGARWALRIGRWIKETAPQALIGRTIAGGKLLIEELIGTGGVGAV